jgi:GAF domain-containing protein
LSVPLLSGEHFAGVLTLHADGRESFTEDQGRLLQMIAPHIARALQLATAAQVVPPPARDLKLVASR